MLPNDMLTAVRACVIEAAHAELTPRFAEVARGVKADGSLVTVADTAMQQRMHAALAASFPEFAFMGEEMSAADQAAALQAGARGMWCLDPLDGTTNFANGVPFFGVSLALLKDGRPTHAWIYDPIRDECFTADASGVWLNDTPLRPKLWPRSLQQCIAVVDFKRLAAPLAARVGREPPYGSQRNFGSCALEWCWLASGRFQLYLHGGQRPWDYAAGALILQQAGGRSCTLADEAIFDGTLATRSVVAALDADLHLAWRNWLGVAPA